ncbi:MAG: 50S ribosomal protein L3 [Candidatus Paceibacterota bacterium]|jgi:large subunit ribosomal protein L3
MKFILGKKENMAEYFAENGQVVPVTIVSILPGVVKKIFSKEKDGYDSVQISWGAIKNKKSTKEKLKEFRLKAGDKVDLKEGDTISMESFLPGDKIVVSSVSKGKGFQGVVKRHGFSGGPRSHGQKHSEREPGSIGGGLRTHVPKGMRMAGRMGSDRITQKNLKVVLVDKENNFMLVKGAIAGKRGTLVEIISR